MPKSNLSGSVGGREKNDPFDNILSILNEDIFRQLVLQRIRIKDISKIIKGNDWEELKT